MTYLTLPSQEELQEYLSYNKDTGLLTWIKRPSQTAKVGSIAGSFQGAGYRCIKFKTVNYLAHRLIWKLVHGTDPGELQIDHINGDRTDNRLDNLRLVTNQENQFNRECAGISFHKASGKWAAYITLDRSQRHIGLYETKDDAIAARTAAKKSLHLVASK